MRAFYGCEVTYVPQDVLDSVDSVRASLPQQILRSKDRR
jgi:hypothetical protein